MPDLPFNRATIYNNFNLIRAGPAGRDPNGAASPQLQCGTFCGQGHLLTQSLYDFDFAVAGGGPAGSSAAISLARRGPVY
jgi:hypothetical protein